MAKKQKSVETAASETIPHPLDHNQAELSEATALLAKAHEVEGSLVLSVKAKDASTAFHKTQNAVRVALGNTIAMPNISLVLPAGAIEHDMHRVRHTYAPPADKKYQPSDDLPIASYIEKAPEPSFVLRLTSKDKTQTPDQLLASLLSAVQRGA